MALETFRTSTLNARKSWRIRCWTESARSMLTNTWTQSFTSSNQELRPKTSALNCTDVDLRFFKNCAPRPFTTGWKRVRKEWSFCRPSLQHHFLIVQCFNCLNMSWLQHDFSQTIAYQGSIRLMVWECQRKLAACWTSSTFFLWIHAPDSFQTQKKTQKSIPSLIIVRLRNCYDALRSLINSVGCVRLEFSTGALRDFFFAFGLVKQLSEKAASVREINWDGRCSVGSGGGRGEKLAASVAFIRQLHIPQ